MCQLVSMAVKESSLWHFVDRDQSSHAAWTHCDRRIGTGIELELIGAALNVLDGVPTGFRAIEGVEGEFLGGGRGGVSPSSYIRISSILTAGDGVSNSPVRARFPGDAIPNFGVASPLCRRIILPSAPTSNLASENSWSLSVSSALYTALTDRLARCRQPWWSCRQSHRKPQYSRLIDSRRGEEPGRRVAASCAASMKAPVVVGMKLTDGRRKVLVFRIGV